MKVNDIKELGGHLLWLGLADIEVMDKLSTLQEGEGFIGKVFARNEDALLNCSYQITRDLATDLYQIEGYGAVLLHIKAIPHGVFEGIDSRALESRLKEVNLFVDWKSASDRHSTIGQLCMELTLLSKSADAQAMEVASLLSLKYLSGTRLCNIIEMSVDRRAFEKEVFIPLSGTDRDIGIDQAHNLLAGRGIMKLKETPEGEMPQAYWLVAEEGHLKPLPEFDIVGELIKLPFFGKQSKDAIENMFFQLINGNKVALELLSMSKGRIDGYIEADPRQGTLGLFKASGECIMRSGTKQEINWTNHTKEKRQGHINGKSPKGKKKGPSL